MIRQVDIADISDGRRYRSSDMVRMDTLGCRGCSRCCRETADTVRLNPMDLHWLRKGTGKDFSGLLQEGYVELKVVDGLVLPHLNMKGSGCRFLDEKGRCRVHDFRPDFCRLFPLGRLYEDGSFSYFLQIHECDHLSAKVRIRKWLEISNLERYEAYILSWHDYTMDAVQVLSDLRSEKLRSHVCRRILELFFVQAWDTGGDFYAQYEDRLREGAHLLGRA